MLGRVFSRNVLHLVLLLSGLFLNEQVFAADTIKGEVLGDGKPIAGSTVTLWEANPEAPKQLAQTKSDTDGRFEVHGRARGSDTVLYLVAAGGTAKAKQGSGENAAIVLLSVLGNEPPDRVVVNELTTVASAFTAARFITGTAISGNPLGLRIAAAKCPKSCRPGDGHMGQGGA